MALPSVPWTGKSPPSELPTAACAGPGKQPLAVEGMRTGTGTRPLGTSPGDQPRGVKRSGSSLPSRAPIPDPVPLSGATKQAVTEIALACRAHPGPHRTCWGQASAPGPWLQLRSRLQDRAQGLLGGLGPSHAEWQECPGGGSPSRPHTLNAKPRDPPTHGTGPAAGFLRSPPCFPPASLQHGTAAARPRHPPSCACPSPWHLRGHKTSGFASHRISLCGSWHCTLGSFL